MRWPKIESRSQNLNGTVANFETAGSKIPVTVAKIDTVPFGDPQKCVEAPVSKIETQIVTRRGVSNVVAIRPVSATMTAGKRGAA
jgi:hypothetical protein